MGMETSGWAFNYWLARNGSGNLCEDYQRFCDEVEQAREDEEYRRMIERECNDW